jgi:TnsA endonuclease C terminal.
VSEAHMDLIDQALQRAGPMPINSLLEAIFSNEWNRASLLPTLWYLIGTFQIGCDLGKPLTMASQAWYLP